MDQKRKQRFKLLNMKLQREVRVPLESADIGKVKEVYEECKSLFTSKRLKQTPLHMAVRLGHNHMVRVFVECAKLSSTDLQTGRIGGFKQFLEYRDLNGRTALDEAANWRNYQNLDLAMFKLLMKESTNSVYDEKLFEVLEKTTKDSPAAVISVDHESRVETTTFMPEEAPSSISHSEMEANTYREAIWGHKMLVDPCIGSIQVSRNKNTVLHIAMQFGKEEFVKDILTQWPSLLYERNWEGETPVYIAAREGHSEIIKMIIDHVKQKTLNHAVEASMEELMKRNIDNTTSLHVAVRNHHAELVFLLTKEIPMLSRCVNDNQESALYIASEKGYHAFVRQIIGECEMPSFQGPHGKTAVHAAALSGSRGCIEHLLNSRADFLHTADKDGCTPLYYAVHFNHSSVVEYLLLLDKALGYHTFGKHGSNIPALHFAASKGHCETMHVLVDKSPGCWEIRNGNGRNILHLAVENKKNEVIEFILADTRFTSLVNQKDNDGNTPLHLLAASDCEMGALVKDHRIELHALNHENKSPLDMASSHERKSRLLEAVVAHRSEDSGYSSKLNVKPADSNFKDTYVTEMIEQTNGVLLVATLIATAAFAAGLAVPGGFDGNEGANQGIPILLKKLSFKVFTIANSLAFICSSSALFGFIRLLYIHIRYRRADSTKAADYFVRLEYRTTTIYSLIGIAMVTMVIAFIAGLFVVLEHKLALAIPLCIICFSVFLFSSLFAKWFAQIVWFLLKYLRLLSIL